MKHFKSFSPIFQGELFSDKVTEEFAGYVADQAVTAITKSLDGQFKNRTL